MRRLKLHWISRLTGEVCTGRTLPDAHLVVVKSCVHSGASESKHPELDRGDPTPSDCRPSNWRAEEEEEEEEEDEVYEEEE